MADITDFFGKASIDTDHSVATTVTADRTAGVTVLSCFDLSTFTEDTPVFFITYTKTTDPLTSEVSITDVTSWKGLVNAGANTITNLTVAPGYVDDGNTDGQFVECIPTSYWNNSLIDGIQAEHKPTGAHSDITADSVTVTGDTIAPTINSVPFADVGWYKEAQYYLNAGSPHTWTKPAGLKFIVVEVQGGGGSGAGTLATGAGAVTASGGGGAGGYTRKKILASDLGATETVTVGAGGAGVSGAAGNSGGTSSFGSFCQGDGGAPGERGTTAAAANGQMANGGAGGASSGGDLNIRGGSGTAGHTAASNNNVGVGGGGGDSVLGAGGRGTVANGGGAGGYLYGGGGGTQARGPSLGATAGASGAAGIVIVHEYF